MKWIRLEASHGPGHQSITVEYIPDMYGQIASEIEVFALSWADKFSNPIMKYDIIDDPPDDVKADIIKKYKDTIYHYQKTLKALGEKI